MSAPSSILERVNTWYLRQCNDEWEHHYGITIESLDNPGWRIRIDLNDTPLEHRAFEARAEGSPEGVIWLDCAKGGPQLRIACNPERLEEALEIFLTWAEA